MTLLDALDEGPARLGSDEVAAAQRRRILAAMVAATAERGYSHVSITDIVSRARVSRTTFYEHYDSKEECFLAAFETAIADLLSAMRAPGTDPPASSGTDRVRAILSSYLTALAAFPEVARVCLVEIYAAGTAGAIRRRDMQRAFVDLLREEAQSLAAAGEEMRMPSDFELEAIVGAVSSLVTQRVAMGEAATLPGLVDPIAEFVVRVFRP